MMEPRASPLSSEKTAAKRRRRASEDDWRRMAAEREAEELREMMEKAFRSEYVGSEPLARLTELLKEAGSSSSRRQAVLLWQSTGWGKSRLLKELAGRQYVVYLSCGEGASSWPRATTWGRQLVELLTAGLRTDEQAIWPKVSFELLAARARAFLAGVVHHMLELVGNAEMPPADWFEHQLSTTCPITLSAECNGSSFTASNLIIAVDEAQVLVETTPYKDNGILLRVLVEACQGEAKTLVLSTSNGKVRSLLPVDAYSILHDLSVSLPVSTEPISTKLTGELEHFCQFGRPLWYALHRAECYLQDIRKLADVRCPTYRWHAMLSMLTGVPMVLNPQVVDELVDSGLATLRRDASGEFTCSYPSEPLITDRALVNFRWHFSEIVDVLDTQLEVAFVQDGVDWADLIARIALLYARSRSLGPYLTVSDLSLMMLGHCDGCGWGDDMYVNYTRFECTKGPVTQEMLLRALWHRVALKVDDEAAYSLVVPFAWERMLYNTVATLDNVGAIFIAVGGRSRSEEEEKERRKALKQHVRRTTGLINSVSWLLEHDRLHLRWFADGVTDWRQIGRTVFIRPQHVDKFRWLVERRLAVRLERTEEVRGTRRREGELRQRKKPRSR